MLARSTRVFNILDKEGLLLHRYSVRKAKL